MENENSQQAKALRMLDDAGFPKRHRERIRKNELFGESVQLADELYSVVESGDCLLALIGDRGPGKTQIGTCWAYKRRMNGLNSGLYFKAHDILTTIKASFDGERKQKLQAEKMLKDLKSTPYLFIDEYSELKGNEFEMRTMTNIIDHRYDDMKATVIASNISLSEAPKQLGRSVWSRLEEIGGAVECDWQSYRNR